MTPMKMQEIETPSGKLAVWTRSGAGMPILLWPSIFYDHRLYDGLVSHLGNPLAVIDGPGHGASGIDKAGLFGASLGNSALAVAKTVFPGQLFTFAGTSWGSLAGMELGALRPPELAALALFNPPWKAPSQPSLSDRAIAFFSRFMVNTGVFRNGIARSFFAPETFKRKPGLIAEFLEQDYVPSLLAPAIHSVMVERHSRNSAAPEAVEVPTLVISGEFDKLYSMETAMQMSARIADSRHVVMASTAHVSAAEDPEQAAKLLLEWIASRTTNPTAVEPAIPVEGEAA